MSPEMGSHACDNCGSKDAVIHLTEIQNNEATICHLCEKCAAAKGLESDEDILRLFYQPISAEMAVRGKITLNNPPAFHEQERIK